MLPSVKSMRSIFLVATLSIGATSTMQAQSSPSNAWQWSVNGNIFAGVNYQHRKAADITEAESQNWLMATGERPLGTGRLRMHTMLSSEPFTLKERGSPQVFQTGETFRNARLVDYQHPHDLFSALSVAYARPEPDETRTDIDFGALDSWSLRGTWANGPWSAQLSGARVNEPDPLSRGDMTRLMASVGHTRTGAISTAVVAAWGQNREIHGNSNAFVFESNISWLDKNHLYSRAELVGKELPHTHGGFPQPMHEVMNVGAFTLGYTRDVTARIFGPVGIGADMTMYYVPLMLQESYDAPLSFHAFLRYRFGTAPAAGEHPIRRPGRPEGRHYENPYTAVST